MYTVKGSWIKDPDPQHWFIPVVLSVVCTPGILYHCAEITCKFLVLIN